MERCRADPIPPGAYGYVYITNTFTNVSIQAQVRFSTSNAWGGGIGGYLNTNTGAHYAAWLYPENSGGGGPAIRLVKFSSWTSFEYETTNFAFMAVTNVASVGTNQHTLRLAFTNQTIQVFYDGNQVISTTDGEATPYTNGAVSLDMYTDATAYVMNVANAEVAVDSIQTAGLERQLQRGFGRAIVGGRSRRADHSPRTDRDL